MKVTFDNDFKNKPKECLLIVAISGTKEQIFDQLNKLIIDVIAPGCKPGQGVYIGADEMRQIITPIWNGEKY